MNKIEAWYRYLKNFVKLSVQRYILRQKTSFAYRQLIGPYSSVINHGGVLRLGEKLNTRSNFHLLVEGGSCSIGQHCFFNHNCSITCMDHIEIGDNSTFGNNLVIVDHDHNIHSQDVEFIKKEVNIGHDVWVGANVTILKGARIGDHCVIAAGSVVRTDIPAGKLFAGGKIKDIEREGEK